MFDAFVDVTIKWIDIFLNLWIWISPVVKTGVESVPLIVVEGVALVVVVVVVWLSKVVTTIGMAKTQPIIATQMKLPQRTYNAFRFFLSWYLINMDYDT